MKSKQRISGACRHRREGVGFPVAPPRSITVGTARMARNRCVESIAWNVDTRYVPRRKPLSGTAKH